MARVISSTESDYVEKRMRPLLGRLKSDRELRARFIAFAMKKGGDPALLIGRLQSAWWPSRTPQFTPFFVLVLTEFAIAEKAPRRKR